MIKTSVVYRQLLAYLRGEHFGFPEQLANESELLEWSQTYAEKYLPEDKQLIFVKDDFQTVQKAFMFEQGFFEMIRKRWNVTDEQIIERGLVSMPTWLESRLISYELKNAFGENVFTLPIFNKQILAFDSKQYRTGFLRPIKKGKTIIGWEVFRSIKDKEPIIF
jgi:hypothetical protein